MQVFLYSAICPPSVVNDSIGDTFIGSRPIGIGDTFIGSRPIVSCLDLGRIEVVVPETMSV